MFLMLLYITSQQMGGMVMNLLLPNMDLKIYIIYEVTRHELPTFLFEDKPLPL